MNKIIRAGIIGCGNIAGLNELDSFREKPCTHLGAYRTRPDVDVIGCCDTSIERVKNFSEKFGIPFFTTSISELLSKGLDIVSICVPYKYHHMLIKEIVSNRSRPQTLFLEKPVSNSLKTAGEIIRACKKRKVKLYVNNRRLTDFYKIFRKAIREKFNNEILSISAWCSSGMHAIGIHMVDLLRYIGGEISWVLACQEKEFVPSLPYSTNFTPDDPRFTSLLKFKNGIKAALFNSARTDFTYFEVDVVCKTGRIRAVDNGKKIIFQEKAKPGSSTLSYRLLDPQEIDVTGQPLFKNLIDEILDGDYSHSEIKGEEAFKSYQVIEAMKDSSKQKKIVMIK